MIVHLILGLAVVVVIGGIAFTIHSLRIEAQSREIERKERESQFREVLTRELRSSTAAGFSFADLVDRCEIDRAEADSVACDIYAALCRKMVDDGVITDTERKVMDRLAKAMEIEGTITLEIEERVKREKYRKAVEGALADGTVSVKEAGDLESLRRSLGITRIDTKDIAEPLSRDAYVALVRRAVRGGVVTEGTKLEIKRLKEALAISHDDAVRFTQKIAMDLYHEAFTMATQDGVLSVQEKNTLAWLQLEAGLSPSQVAIYLQQLRDIERFAEYRNGQLPVVQTRKLLEGGESCHWEGSCRFRYETTRNILSTDGELIVTSKRLMMNSPSKSVTFSPAKIIDLVLNTNCLQITTSSRQGTGHYFVDSPRELEAILSGLARKHKFLLSESYSSAYSRHIPDDVKREVWDRDRGRCVRCNSGGQGAYLEFDHIIPHSKGGANTVNNVQLLCRNCNLLKGDRI